MISQGRERRLEYIVKNEQQVFIDDYAHHPDELKALIGGARSLFVGKKCTVVFSTAPVHKNKGFCRWICRKSDMADEIILLPIYPARELPIEGVNSEMILNKMKNRNSRVMSKEKLLEYIESCKVSSGGRFRGALLITAGAGDIDTMVDPIKQKLVNPDGGL